MISILFPTVVAVVCIIVVCIWLYVHDTDFVSRLILSIFVLVASLLTLYTINEIYKIEHAPDTYKVDTSNYGPDSSRLYRDTLVNLNNSVNRLIIIKTPSTDDSLVIHRTIQFIRVEDPDRPGKFIYIPVSQIDKD